MTQYDEAVGLAERWQNGHPRAVAVRLARALLAADVVVKAARARNSHEERCNCGMCRALRALDQGQQEGEG